MQVGNAAARAAEEARKHMAETLRQQAAREYQRTAAAIAARPGAERWVQMIAYLKSPLESKGAEGSRLISKSFLRMPFRDHPLKLERYREY